MTEKITVLHLRQSAGGGGGADRVILNSTSLIDKNQFNIIIVYLRSYKDDLSLIADKLRGKEITCFDLQGKRFFDFKQFLNFIKIIKKNKVKIVHCHDPKSDLYGYLLKIFSPELKIISTMHGWIKRRQRSMLYNKVDRLILKRFNAVIAVSEDIEQIAKKHGIRRTHLIHNGIDTDKWQPLKEDNLTEVLDTSKTFKVGFVGRISKEKGPDVFVSVAQNILKQHTCCEFLVAGDGPERGYMEGLVKNLGIEDRFHFLGMLDDNKLFDLYNRMDLLLLTSYTEGLSMVTLEACSMSVPVVATRVGGSSEIITHNHNGLLADAGDIESLTNLALRIINNSNLAERLRKNGRITVENSFSLMDGVKNLEKLYQRILK